jgi:SAM-dependent methyltransferase
LVSNDPLYLADKNYELLKPCQSGYHEVYRRRLREYVIDDSQEGFLTHQLPLSQFGLVFAWNYFELRTQDVLTKYVCEIAQLLRPGGHFVFTYNNCDHENGIRLIDHHSGTYMDRATIKKIADQYGLQISNYHGHSNVAWIELKRPGEIASLRGGQSLAKIVAEPK